jgi:putative hydrolase of the HAD superfamily
MQHALVIFDLGGVLVDFETDRLINAASQVLGRPFEEVRAAIYEDSLLLPLEVGQIKPQVYYERLKEQLPLPWKYEQFVRIWNDSLRENPDTVWMLQRLRKRYKLMALTNTNVLHLEYIRTQMPSLTVLDHWVASCDVGLRKPDQEIYRLALTRAGVRANSAVYVDDRPEMVEAGRQAGLTAIRFEHHRQLEQDLQSVGLQF